VPKLSDKLIGTSVGGEIEDITYNFTLLELLELFLPVIPANNLQGVLDYGNTATQDINLFGTITTTNLNVTDTANLYITYLNEETHIVGSVFDSLDLVGTPGQVLTSTGEGVEWYTLPPIFTPNLQQVLTEGNTADIDILLDANLEALNVSADTANIATQLSIQGVVMDYNESVGSAGQVLSSTATTVEWVSLPVYSATSPLLFDSGTGVFSIQVANATQGGYLSANDWITFDGKQNAGNYITALTGEATASGPGSVPITLNNASVIAKVLTGLNITGGSISATDSILAAFGKVQNQINGLMGGVQYQGVWNANTNTPTLTSSVGSQGWYYIVNVAGTTDLNGITDWQVGDWAIFSGGAWQKVDNTDSVTSVNGQTGAVSLTTDNIPEGTTNLYFLNSRARAALSFQAGSGAYNNTTGVITIPTDNSQILNGAGYITLGSLSASSPLSYNNLTGAFSIQQASGSQNGYLSSTDWTTFNNKQNYLNGTGLVKSTAGTITYITDNSGNWNTAYDRSIVSAAVTGTTTKTLTLNEQDGNTITASWTDLDTGLTSVGVSMPSAFSVANSPLTSNGTIAITGAGTTLEYIDGTGALRTFPGLTGYVPYTGATTNVDLGEFGISAGYFQADLTPTGALQVGRMQWNSTDGTMDLRLMGNNVTLQIGEENVTRVVNKSGVDLLEANYQVVRIRKVAEGGAQGQRLAVVLAQGNSENNSTEVLGLVTETINVNQEGFVTNFGEVKEINTTGSLQGETWVDGNILYLSDTVAGGLTNVRPVAPNHSVIVGYVTYAHAIHGKIYVAVDTGYELGELHNVYAPSPANNASIWWNSSTLRYENNTIAGILGYTPADNSLVVHLAGTETITGDKTFTTPINADYGVLLKNGVIPSANSTQVGLGSNGAGITISTKPSSIVYYNNFYFPSGSNNYTLPNASGTIALVGGAGVGTVTSVAALTLGTAGTDLSSTVANPTTTPVITLNVPTASAANRGALSAADWSTFNTKVGSVTASSPLASSGGSTPNITIQQSSGSQDGYLSSTDWTTFNNKQAAGNYITSLTGEATGTGPGATAVTLNNASVTAKILTGINITGGTVQATDTMLTAFGKLQNQINGLIGSTIYQGTWNASTNTPALASGVGVRGYYYIVSVAGNTNLDGITDWFVGDWAIFDGTAWQQVDNTDAVVSVNGFTGAVSLTTDNIPEGTTNQYFLNSRARSALSFTAGSGAYNSTTGVITIPTNTNQLTNGASFITLASLSGTAPIVYSNTTGAISITQAGTASNGYLSSTDWNTFNNKQAAGNYVTTDTTQTISGVKTFELNTLKTDGGILFKDNVVPSSTTSGYVKAWFNINGTKNSLGLTSSATSPYYYYYDFPNVSGTIALTSDIPSLAGYVPYTGATGSVDLGIYGLTAYSLYLKKNGTNGSNIIWDTTTGQVIANTGQTSIGPVGTDGFGVYFAGATKAFYFSATNITAQRIYTMPNASGTIALTSDIPVVTGYVPYTGATGSVNLGAYNLTATTLTATTLTDGLITISSAQINRADGFVEMQFTGAQGVRIFGNTAYPITFAKTTGNATFSSNLYISGGTNTNVGNGIHAYYESDYAQIQLNGTSTGGSLIDFATSGSDYFGRIVYRNTTNQFEFNTNAVGTPALTLTSAGNATVSGTVTGSSIIKSGGTSSQFLKADGSVDSNTYVTTDTTQSISGLKTFTSVITSTVSAGDSINLNKPTGPQITLNKTNATAQSWGIAADPNFRIINVTLAQDALSFNFSSNVGTFTQVPIAPTYAITNGLTATGTIDKIAGGLLGSGDIVWLTAARVSSFISLGSYVPYTGATGNVNLGTYGLTAGSITDGYIIMSAAQINRVGFFVEMQYNGVGGVQFFGNTAYPIIFTGATGASQFSSNLYISGGTNTNVGNGIHAYYESNYAQIQLNGISTGGGLIDFSTSGTDYLGRIRYDNTANYMQFSTNSSSKMTLDSLGSLGLGVIPSSWGSTRKALEGTFGQSWFYNNTSLETGLVSNAYHNGTNWVYSTYNAAYKYETGNVGHAWYIAPVGSGNITFTKAMTLFDTGNLNLGINSDNGRRLRVSTSSADYAAQISQLGSSAGSHGLTIDCNSSSSTIIGFEIYSSSASIYKTRLYTDGSAYFSSSITANSNSTINGAGVNTFQVNASSTTNTVRFMSTGGTTSRIISEISKVEQNSCTVDVRAHGATYGPETLFSNACANTAMILGLPAAGAVFAIGNYNNGPMVFGTNNAERARIMPSGNFLINTDVETAGYKLQVAGTIRVLSSSLGLSIDGGTGTLDRGVITTHVNRLEQLALVRAGVGTFGIHITTGGVAILSGQDTNTNMLSMVLATGAATFASSVTATSFFESSDKRLKTLIKDDYKALGVENIKPKLYIKDGKEEVGYFAQDFWSILSSAVSKNDAGFLSLSYTQVHTAKIAIIEDEVTVLKRRVAELESKLQA
jgi:hypothetical protein